MGDVLKGGGEAAIYRFIGSLTVGEVTLPSIDELSALDTESLKLLRKLALRGIKDAPTEEDRVRIRRFINDHLSPAIRLKLTKAIKKRADMLWGIRFELFELTWISITNLHLFINSAELLPEALEKERRRLGADHVKMVDQQFLFIDRQGSEFSETEYRRLIKAITLVEAGFGYDTAFSYFETYSTATLEKDSALSLDEGATDGLETEISHVLLGGRIRSSWIASVLIHELVHVSQVRAKGSDSGEGRAYGVDWQVASVLDDAGRREATETRMEFLMGFNVNEVADYCVTCVAANMLDSLRLGASPVGMPATLRVSEAAAKKFYFELMTSVPSKFSGELVRYLNDIGRSFRAGALSKGGWINRNQRIPVVCRVKQFRSNLFDQIEDGTFAALPPNP
jgi:hypothetical protein